MSNHATSSFNVTGWDQTPYDDGVPGPVMGRATVKKTFTGDLEGESVAELLLCQADAKDIKAGAGFIGSERVTGRLGEREGSFVMQHWGVIDGDAPPRTGGSIIPGSGTDGLTGITGAVEISVDAEGKHTLTLDYEIS